MKHRIMPLFVLLVSTAAAFGADYTWNGSSSEFWQDQSSWTPFSDYPRLAADRATIGVTTNNPIEVATSETIGSLFMRNGSSGTPISLQVDSSVTLSLTNSTHDGKFTIGDTAATSYVEMVGPGSLSAISMEIAADSASSNGQDVTFRYNAGSLQTVNPLTMYASTSVNAEAYALIDATGFAPASLDLFGGSTNAREVVFEVNADMSLSDVAMVPEAKMSGFVRFAIDNADADLKDIQYVADGDLNVTLANGGQLLVDEFKIEEEDDEPIEVTKSGAGQITAAKFVISASASEPAVFEVAAGSIVTQ